MGSREAATGAVLLYSRPVVGASHVHACLPSGVQAPHSPPVSLGSRPASQGLNFLVSSPRTGALDIWLKLFTSQG